METRIDQRRIDAFARRMAGQLNEAMLALLTSIAHQTGLFDAMAALPPSPSEAIAAAAGLDERYVREWLAAMVTGRIVDYDGLRGLYHLPAEHAASLTRAARSANLAGRAPRVAALAQLEADLVELFRRGGGLSAASFARLRDIEVSEIEDQESNLIAAIAPRWPGLGARLESGIDVLELRPGDRRGASALAAHFPQSRWALRAAREALDGRPLDLVITWEVFAHHGDPAGLLRTIRSSLRPHGCLLSVEVAASSNLADNIDRACAPLLYATSTMQSLPLSLAAGGTAVGIMWGEESARRMLAETGFGPIQTGPFGRDPGRVCLLAKPLER